MGFGTGATGESRIGSLYPKYCLRPNTEKDECLEVAYARTKSEATLTVRKL